MSFLALSVFQLLFLFSSRIAKSVNGGTYLYVESQEKIQKTIFPPVFFLNLRRNYSLMKNCNLHATSRYSICRDKCSPSPCLNNSMQQAKISGQDTTYFSGIPGILWARTENSDSCYCSPSVHVHIEIQDDAVWISFNLYLGNFLWLQFIVGKLICRYFETVEMS